MPQIAETASQRAWSVAAFSRFWANPDPARLPAVRSVVTEDIVGYWPRPIGIVRGRDAYLNVIEAVVTAQPQMRLRLGEHAATGDFSFIRWIGSAR